MVWSDQRVNLSSEDQRPFGEHVGFVITSTHMILCIIGRLPNNTIGSTFDIFSSLTAGVQQNNLMLEFKS